MIKRVECFEFRPVDREISGTVLTKPYDYTKKGQIVIFEHEKRK